MLNIYDMYVCMYLIGPNAFDEKEVYLVTRNYSMLHNLSCDRPERINISSGVNLCCPSVSTLRSYIGKSTGDVGFTPIAEKRLASLAATLDEQEKEVSLEIDEMAIVKK